jgi:tetratricopeptide (TPR) repeat protein
MTSRLIAIAMIFLLLILLPAFPPDFTASSSAFAFRTLEPGKKVPEIKLKDTVGAEFTLSSVTAKACVILFWGTDTEIKEKRSISLINRMEKLSTNLRSEGLQFVSIISDPGSAQKVKALREQHAWSHRILLDENRQVYGAYGVYILPTIGILDAEQKLVKALPYTHTLESDAESETLVIMGKKSAEELEQERRPAEAAPENSKKARAHVNLAKSLLEKGRKDGAKEEYLKALQLDPGYPDACVGLGMIHLNEKNVKEAMPLLEKGVTLDPTLTQGQIGLALALESAGEHSKAIDKLEGLLRASQNTPQIRYHLGRLYEQGGQKERALAEYRKALQSLFKGE